MPKPPFPYPGGKRRLADRIIGVMVPHKTYVEPFIGGGAVFFMKDPAKKNVISDMDPNVVQFYKDFDCKSLEGCSSVKDVCDFSSKSMKKIKKGRKTTACEFMAARRMSIMAGGDSLATNKCGIEPIVPKTLKGKACKDIEKRLYLAEIRHGDFRKITKKEDSKSTLFFMDPPYWRTSNHYKDKTLDPKEVFGLLRTMKGRAIVTYNDHPDVRKAAKGLFVVRVPSFQAGQSIGGKKQLTHELMIMNFKPHITVKAGKRKI